MRNNKTVEAKDAPLLRTMVAAGQAGAQWAGRVGAGHCVGGAPLAGRACCRTRMNESTQVTQQCGGARGTERGRRDS